MFLLPRVPPQLVGGTMALFCLGFRFLKGFGAQWDPWTAGRGREAIPAQRFANLR